MNIMSPQLTNEGIEQLADAQYKLGIDLTEKHSIFYRMFHRTNENEAMLAFAQAYLLYRRINAQISANICRANISGIAKRLGKTEEEKEKIYLKAHQGLQRTFRLLEEISRY